MHTFQGSVPESVRTSFAPCALSVRLPGARSRPALHLPDLLYNIMRIVFIYSGIRASGEALGVRRPHARRPGRRRTMQPAVLYHLHRSHLQRSFEFIAATCSCKQASSFCRAPAERCCRRTVWENACTRPGYYCECCLIKTNNHHLSVALFS